MFHRETVDVDAIGAFTTAGSQRVFRINAGAGESPFEAKHLRLRNQSAARSIEFSFDGTNVHGIADTTALTTSDTGTVDLDGRRQVWLRRAGGAATGAAVNVIVEAWR